MCVTVYVIVSYESLDIIFANALRIFEAAIRLTSSQYYYPMQVHRD